MSSQTIQFELQQFVQFATRRIASGQTARTVEDLVQQWRGDAESLQAIADVRQGMADDADGRAVSVTEAFANIRRQARIAE